MDNVTPFIPRDTAPTDPASDAPPKRIFHVDTVDNRTLSALGYLAIMSTFVGVMANYDGSELELVVPWGNVKSITAEPDTDVEVA